MKTSTGCLLLIVTLALAQVRALPAGGESSFSWPSSFDSTAGIISSEAGSREQEGPTAVESGSSQMASSSERYNYKMSPQSWYSNPMPTDEQASLGTPPSFPPPRLDTIIAEKRERRRKKIAFSIFKERIGYLDIKPTLLAERFYRNLTPQIIDGLLSSDERIVRSAFEIMKPRCIFTAAIDQQTLALVAHREDLDIEEDDDGTSEIVGKEALEEDKRDGVGNGDDDEGENEERLDLSLSLGQRQRGKRTPAAHTDTGPTTQARSNTSSSPYQSPVSKWARENPHRKRQVYEWLCQALSIPSGARGAKKRRKWKHCLNTHSTKTNIAGLSSLDPLVVSQALRSLQNIDEQGKRGTYKAKARQV